ncbi:hypothetical protein GCM10027589_24230 [Actinocorallia lasiicapitis]
MMARSEQNTVAQDVLEEKLKEWEGKGYRAILSMLDRPSCYEEVVRNGNSYTVSSFAVEGGPSGDLVLFVTVEWSLRISISPLTGGFTVKPDGSIV